MFLSVKKIVALVLVAGCVFSASAKADELEEGLTLMKGSDCFTCHRVAQKLIGPAYKDVAAKYPNADDAKITELAQKVIKGGQGNWGNVPMRAHPTLQEADVKKMVKWVLAQTGAAPAAGGTAAPATTTPAATTPPATN